MILINSRLYQKNVCITKKQYNCAHSIIIPQHDTDTRKPDDNKMNIHALSGPRMYKTKKWIGEVKYSRRELIFDQSRPSNGLPKHDGTK